MIKQTTLFLISRLAQSWNTLNIDEVAHQLDNDVIYQSQWNYVPIKGKVFVTRHLSSKFNAIAEAKKSGLMNVTAHVVTHPHVRTGPAVLVTQITDQCIRQVLQIISIKGKRISHIDVCFTPDPLKSQIIDEMV